MRSEVREYSPRSGHSEGNEDLDKSEESDHDTQSVKSVLSWSSISTTASIASEVIPTYVKNIMDSMETELQRLRTQVEVLQSNQKVSEEKEVIQEEKLMTIEEVEEDLDKPLIVNLMDTARRRLTWLRKGNEFKWQKKVKHKVLDRPRRKEISRRLKIKRVYVEITYG